MDRFFARNTGSVNPPIPPDPSDPLQPLGVEGWSRFYNFGSGVDGGGSGEFVEFTDFDALWDDLRATEAPKNYLYTGPDTVLDDVDYRSNGRSHKRIKASNGQTLEGGTLRFDGGENIILDNFRRYKSFNDLIRILGTVGMVLKNLDLDGGAFFNGTEWVYPTLDGNLDITQEADLITVLNCKIRNGNRTHLVGASDSEIGDRGKLRVTTTGCLFVDNGSRQPAGRFTQYDLVNCYMTTPNRSGRITKGITPSIESKINIRSCFFEDMRRVVEETFTGTPGEYYLEDVQKVNIDNSDTGPVSPTRLWTYPDLNGQYYDVPLLGSSEAKTYCLSSLVGPQIIV